MKKYFIFLTLLFLSTSAYTQILIDDGPIIINKKTSIAPDYAIQGNNWNHRILTYWFSNGTTDITGTEERTAIRTALELWQNQTDIRFLEACDSIHADMIFRWAIGDHGDGYPFDGVNNVLAHGFFPPPNGDYAGDVHFDDAETWTIDTRTGSDQPIDLITIAAHEIGHTLGLQHSSVSNALMYAYYSGSHRYLDQDDINGIRSIYGNPGTNDFISGSSSVCISGTVFTINNPNGGTITWNQSSNLSRVSDQGSNPCTFAAIGPGSGSVQATITTTGCGNVTLPQKNITTVWPTGTWVQNGQSHPLSTVNFVNYGSWITTTVACYGATSFNWQLTGSSGINWNQYYPYGDMNLYLNNSQSYGDFRLNINTQGCGTISPTYHFVPGYSYGFTMSPNPATSELVVSRIDKNQADESIMLKPKKEKFKDEGFQFGDKNLEEYSVKLYSEKQGLLKSAKTKGESYKIDLRDLPSGTYFLHIENDYILYQEQIIIQK